MRHQDFRNSRRRDFDADTYYPQPRAFGTRPRFSQPRFEPPSGPPVSGIVKWFNPEKGFGFVELSDGSGDAFLHGSVLTQSGIHSLARRNARSWCRPRPKRAARHRGAERRFEHRCSVGTTAIQFPGRDIGRTIFRHGGRGDWHREVVQCRQGLRLHCSR